MRGIDKLPEYSGMISKWKITNLSSEDLFSDSKSTFVYLDPPYEIGSNLYGKRGNMHKGFDHDLYYNSPRSSWCKCVQIQQLSTPA